MDYHDYIKRSFFALFMSTGLLSIGMAAQTRSGASDAQLQAEIIRSLSAVPNLAGQAISVATNSGVATLSGSVHNEAQRTYVDQLVATTAGVRRVIDQLSILDGTTTSQEQMPSTPPYSVLQSDGTYTASSEGTVGPPGAVQGQTQKGAGYPLQTQDDGVPPPNGPNTDAYGRPLTGQQSVAPPESATQPENVANPINQPSFGEAPPINNSSYGQPRRGYAQPGSQGYAYASGQPGGQMVTLPVGTLLRVRVNQHLSSRDVSVGALFDAMVVNDIVAEGQVAVPRGTLLQGSVVEAESSGHLKGRGELGLKLTQVTLGGRTYPISSEIFSAHGGDKTIQTVNSTVGLGALGAIFGAVAGGGVGAAIGAGAGGAIGLGASASSGRGDVFIPSEAVLTFRLNQPAQITTVSQAEMQRLASNVQSGSDGSLIRRRYPYGYYGPVVYPRYYYRPYGSYPY